MADPRWGPVLNVARTAARFMRTTGEERQRRAMMAALAYRPHEAQTRAWEAQIPADVDAPMRQVNDALAQMRPRAPLSRAQLARDLWALIPGGSGSFNFRD